jgi:hypothetical protein
MRVVAIGGLTTRRRSGDPPDKEIASGGDAEFDVARVAGFVREADFGAGLVVGSRLVFAGPAIAFLIPSTSAGKSEASAGCFSTNLQ